MDNDANSEGGIIVPRDIEDMITRIMAIAPNVDLWTVAENNTIRARNKRLGILTRAMSRPAETA